MEFLNVVAAAAASWVFGAIWYMAFSKPWLRVSGVKLDENGKPAGSSDPTPFLLSAVAMLLVAGFLRYIVAHMPEIDTVAKGGAFGLGVGLFFIAPWTMINNAYPGRPYLLTVIDGGYSVFGCGLIGAILLAF